MSLNRFSGAVPWALMLALVCGAGAVVQAQEEEEQANGGPVIQIGRPDEGQQPGPSVPPPNEGLEQPRVQQPKHWVGLLFGEIGPDSPLRAHVDLPEGQGLLIDQVMPNSPAEKAGLKRHDILLRANDSELRDKQDLVELVIAAGDKGEQISLEVLRRGKRETVYVTPEERPADAVPPALPPQPFGGEFGLPGGFEIPQELFREFGPGAFEFRQFGPGVILGERGRGLANMPSGVSVSVQKEGNQPPRVTVKRGDETWEVVGDDPEALKQLPDDLRPLVENMLRGGPVVGFRGQGRQPMPEFGDGRLRERLERMERRMQELQERFRGPEGAPADEAQDEGESTK